MPCGTPSASLAPTGTLSCNMWLWRTTAAARGTMRGSLCLGMASGGWSILWKGCACDCTYRRAAAVRPPRRGSHKCLPAVLSKQHGLQTQWGMSMTATAHLLTCLL